MRRLRAGRDVLTALGGPWVTVRAHYGALPSVAGRVPAKGGETCPDGERKLAPVPGSQVPGSKKSPQVERREALPCASVSRRSGRQAAACYTAPFGAPPPPHA